MDSSFGIAGRNHAIASPQLGEIPSVLLGERRDTSGIVTLLDDCFAANRRWADTSRAEDPTFFSRLEALQTPELLWIGCSDSRLPPNEIIGRAPGELFVHRNVGNLVVHSDLNCLSVLQFAVDVLEVEHVIVCGHYGCAGVRAALRGERHGLCDNWLRHIQDTARAHGESLAALPDAGHAREDRLCELNVIEQVGNVFETTVVQDAWARGQRLTVHGWIYRLEDGLIRDLGLSVAGPGDRDTIERAKRSAP